MTDTHYVLSDGAQARMLHKLMLYWDGQRFLKTTETFGLDAAIDLNARVRSSFGRIEMRTLLKTLGKPHRLTSTRLRGTLGSASTTVGSVTNTRRYLPCLSPRITI